LKSSRGIRKPEWMNKELLTKLGHERDVYKKLKQDRCPGINLETLLEHTEIALGKPKPTYS